MAEFSFDGNKIHYEIYGEGRPLLILNGIMMSTKSWSYFITEFSKNNKLILVDFLDQGESERMVGKTYSQADQVEVVRSLLKEINLEKVTICGISYGGEVGIQFAAKYPECVDKLILSNTAARTNPWLKDIGDAWNLAGENENCGLQYYLTTIPVIYSSRFYEAKLDWMRKRQDVLVPFFNNKDVQKTFKRLVISAESLDAVDKLSKITAKTLIISSDEDCLTPPVEQRILNEKINGSELLIMPKSGHASMYEKPELWASIVLGFANMTSDITI